MREVRCIKCGKLLCKIEKEHESLGKIEIKCPRCKTINEVK